MHVLGLVLHILYEFIRIRDASQYRRFLPHSVNLRSVIFVLVFAFCGQNVLCAQCHFCVAGQFIIIISHELGLDRPVSAFSISLFKGLSVCNGKCVSPRSEFQEQLFIPQRTHLML